MKEAKKEHSEDEDEELEKNVLMKVKQGERVRGNRRR